MLLCNSEKVLCPAGRCVNMMNHSARFTFSTPYAEKLYNSVLPEVKSDPGDRSHVELTKDENCVTLIVKAEDASALRASLNMWLRLINVSQELLEL